ncbi:MAG: TonB family protein [Candidatus Omnitrophica bacterium]|nr:TonB family protein [Candidatus Omnitrophota bacterium]
MFSKRITTLYLFVLVAVTLFYPTVSFAYPQASESITQYIVDLSNDIQRSIHEPGKSLLQDSKGELKLKLLLSPWGELEDAYVSESSGSAQLDNICLEAVRMYDRFPPFPEELGDEDRWVDVPIIFDINRPEPLASLGYGAGGIYAEASASAEDAEPTRKIIQLGVTEAVDIALENHMAARIAKEEIDLSRLKIREARRALYPAASLNYMETMGKTTKRTQDFTDKEYKVKFEYPLYYGWRLRYAVSQAISNMKASRYNLDKVQQDLKLEVETAFYSYLAASSDVEIQKALLKEVNDIFTIAKKRFDLGLTTKSEFLQAESQLKQVGYQVASSEGEMEMAALTLTQAMNVENIDDLVDVGDAWASVLEAGAIDIDMSLDECMDLAFRHRPDLKSKEYMVEFNDYERKIAKSKDHLKVDLTGTYGKSGGAYESEALNMSNDWYMGFKVSKPLGGNTLAASYTKEETSEKHGQSSRTESAGKSLELGILDNLQSFSEKKSTEIALKKAKDEFQQAKDAIFKEVKESYLNYKKGTLQVRANLNKTKHKEEELKLAKARSELNEIPLSEFMRAHMNLTDEKSFYIDALGSMYQSLAKLNKATGYTLFLDSENFELANLK